MKEIRLCDDSLFGETIKKCEKNRLGIEVQAFAELITRKIGESQEEVDSRIEEEILKEKSILDNMNCGKSLHAPHAGIEIGTKDNYDYEKIMKYLNKAYQIASKLGCTEIVVHNGYKVGTYYYPKYIERSIDFWKNFLKDKNNSITICIENQFELDSDMMKQIIDGVADNRLKACLDIGHAHANSIMTVEKWIETLGDRIAYYHLHNNHGRKNIPNHNDDEHLGISHGTIDIAKVLEYSEKYSPNAIWNLESRVEYHIEDIKKLKTLGYIKE